MKIRYDWRKKIPMRTGDSRWLDFFIFFVIILLFLIILAPSLSSLLF
jgi:hypothetical protein